MNCSFLWPSIFFNSRFDNFSYPAAVPARLSRLRYFASLFDFYLFALEIFYFFPNRRCRSSKFNPPSAINSATHFRKSSVFASCVSPNSCRNFSRFFSMMSICFRNYAALWSFAVSAISLSIFPCSSFDARSAFIAIPISRSDMLFRIVDIRFIPIFHATATIVANEAICGVQSA